MIHVLASISVKQDKVSEFLQIFKDNVPTVKAEEGCIYYAPCMDLATGFPSQEMDDCMVTVVEQWESLDHLKAHAVAPHMMEYRKKVKEMVVGESLKILEEK